MAERELRQVPSLGASLTDRYTPRAVAGVNDTFEKWLMVKTVGRRRLPIYLTEHLCRSTRDHYVEEWPALSLDVDSQQSEQPSGRRPLSLGPVMTPKIAIAC